MKIKPNRKQKLFIVLLVCLVIVGGIYFFYPLHAPRYPNILLITVDALRPDHLGCYGYKKNTSPNIDKLAREGVMFTQAISQASWTWPSIHSLSTATYPSTHGVHFWDQNLLDSFSTLPQMLRKKGYSTGFISAHGSLSKFNRGFDFFVDISSAKADGITKKAILWIEKNKKNPFFLWLHYMDTHSKSYCSIPIEERSVRDLSKKDIEEGYLRYDMAINYVDAQFKLLLERLKDLGMYRNTLIILTADHGEAMGEHSYYFLHGGTLWDSLIKVPLILSYPTRFKESKIINQQVQFIDIVPTILEMLKIKIPGYMEGKSFLSLIQGLKAQIMRYAFSEVRENIEDEFGNPYTSTGEWSYTKFSIRGNDYKLMRTLDSHGERYQLYNLKTDPQELNNLVEIEKEQFEFLKAKLEEWMNRPKPDITPLTKSLDEDTKDRLRSLGYLQ